MIRLATWNVNSLRVRLPHLLRWLTESRADVVCLQETKVPDDQFPVQDLAEAGYPHLAYCGERAYNGVAIVSRHPLSEVRHGLDPEVDRGQKRLVAATVCGIRVLCAYVVNGKRVGSPDFAWKLAWLDALRAHLDAHCDPGDPVALCGDMNIAPGDLDVWDPFQCDGTLLCHPHERARFQAFLDWGLKDSFRELHPFATDFTWWDYRQMGFQRNHGLRIDHILLTGPLMSRCRDVTLWRDTRGWDQPSDHIPVSVDLEV